MGIKKPPQINEEVCTAKNQIEINKPKPILKRMRLVSKAIYFNPITQGANGKSHSYILTHDILQNSNTVSDADDLILPPKSFREQVISNS